MENMHNTIIKNCGSLQKYNVQKKKTEKGIFDLVMTENFSQNGIRS